MTSVTPKKVSLPYRVLCTFVAFSFAFTTIVPPNFAQVVNMPVPGTMVPLSAGYVPASIKGLTINAENPLEFNFIVDAGDSGLQGEAFRAESTKLVKYFLASLTVPEKDLWVNLSPYEKDRIVPQNFGVTEMGRDLLAQDYILKQLSSSLMYPEDQLGAAFWNRVYEKAERLHGTRNIPLNTFNKIWIVPETAVVYQNGATAFVLESRLKVMLEEDYMALQKNIGSEKYGLDRLSSGDAQVYSGVMADVVKDVLIPEIEKEVNEGKNFANLRQIYDAVILAKWYKQNLMESLLGKVYVNQNKIKGVDIADKDAKEKIYEQYVEAFKTGVYNYIKEEYDPVSRETAPRKYFSGGVDLSSAPQGASVVDPAIVTVRAGEELTPGQQAALRRVVASKDLHDVEVRLAASGQAMISANELIRLKETGELSKRSLNPWYNTIASVFIWLKDIGADLSYVDVLVIGEDVPDVAIVYNGGSAPQEIFRADTEFRIPRRELFNRLSKFFNIEDGIVQPVGVPVDLSKPLPKKRWVYSIKADEPAGSATDAIHLDLVDTPEVRPDEVLVEVYAVPAEANAGRWLPERKPVDVVGMHGQPFHVPGNNPVGRVVALGSEAQKHIKLGDLVVVHNGMTQNPLDHRMLRGDTSLQQTVRSFDSFRDAPDDPVRAGGHAQFVAAKWWQAMPKPAELTFEQAAVYPLADPTIRNNFSLTRLGEGDTFLLVGASGSTGLRAIEIAKELGVKRIIGIVSTDEKARLIESKSTDKTQIIAINRKEYDDLKTDEGVKRFAQKVIELNEGEGVDVALDFFGARYPETFFQAVKRGDPNNPQDLGGRFTSYGAELQPQVSVRGTQGETGVETMFQRVEFFRDRPDTEELLRINEEIWANDPQALVKIQEARETASADRKIKRVVIYGTDEEATSALYAAQKRDAEIVVIVGRDDVGKVEDLRQEPGVQAVLSIADYVNAENVIDKDGFKKLAADIRAGFNKARADLIVERARPEEVLGVANGEALLNFNLMQVLDTGGQIIYSESTAGREYKYDQRAWVLQKDILFPDASIILTHYAPIAQAFQSNQKVAGGLPVDNPTIFRFSRTPEALQAQGFGKNVILHGIPPGVKSLEGMVIEPKRQTSFTAAELIRLNRTGSLHHSAGGYSAWDRALGDVFISLQRQGFELFGIDVKLDPAGQIMVTKGLEPLDPDFEVIFRSDSRVPLSHDELMMRFHQVVPFEKVDITDEQRQQIDQWLTDVTAKNPEEIVQISDEIAGGFDLTKAELLRVLIDEFNMTEIGDDAFVGYPASAPEAILVGSPVEKPQEVGGIDLNPAFLDLQIRRDENGVPLPAMDQPIQNMNIEGFLPVIINVAPITNMPLILGLDGNPDGGPSHAGSVDPRFEAKARFEFDNEV